MEGWSKGEENYHIKFPPFRGRSELNDQRDNLKKNKKTKSQPSSCWCFHALLCGTRSNFFPPPGHFHTIPECHCPATERHYAVKLISQIWCSPFQMPARLQLCCCDHRQFGDFHILQTECRRLDLSVVFAGSPAFRIDAAAAVPRLGPVWADCFHFQFFSFFFLCLDGIRAQHAETGPLGRLRRVPSGSAVCFCIHLSENRF